MPAPTPREPDGGRALRGEQGVTPSRAPSTYLARTVSSCVRRSLRNGQRVRLAQIDTREVYFGTECYGPRHDAESLKRGNCGRLQLRQASAARLRAVQSRGLAMAGERQDIHLKLPVGMKPPAEHLLYMRSITQTIASGASRLSHDDQFAGKFSDAIHRRDNRELIALFDQMGLPGTKVEKVDAKVASFEFHSSPRFKLTIEWDGGK